MRYTEDKECLNGWWDFHPNDKLTDEAAIPVDGWEAAAYLVPSVYDKSLGGVRRKGERFYREELKNKPEDYASEAHEFLFDNFRYPVRWMKAHSAWARRSLTASPLQHGRRRFLRLDAVAGRSEIWVNGRRLAIHEDAFLPKEVDVTDALVEGPNEIAVLIRDFERLPTEKRETLTPSGNMMSAHMRGIWQDVWMVERGAVRVSELFVQTSWRKKCLSVEVELTNAGATSATVALEMDVSEWLDGSEPFEGESCLEIGADASRSVLVPAGATVSLNFERPWEAARPWQPESPALYWLRAVVREAGSVTDCLAQRFGFREVWFEGPDLFLNGYPVHLFSDWGHKLNQLHHTKAWNRCWFAMMRQENFNHTRLHTHPHPESILDLADEAGILVTGETAIHGSGGEQAAGEDAYWEAARAHVEAFIKRDRNHPSLILWSVENEMRWNPHGRERTKRELPALRTLFRKLDPGREAYHEGDSSMWNETDQPIISRHYGKECGGVGWWDRARPLLAGEMSSYHYMGPNTNFHTGGGDELWADYIKVVEASARETKWIVEAGRTCGVVGFGPWNISCLVNLRPWKDPVTLDYEDWTSPGVKPRFIEPHSAEFAFWQNEAPAYAPCGEANAIQASAFRPVALIDLSPRTSYYAGQTIVRSLYLVNDSSEILNGRCSARLRDAAGHSVYEASEAMPIDRGRVSEWKVSLRLPEVEASQQFRWEVAYIDGSGQERDGWSQTWKVVPAQIPALDSKHLPKACFVGAGPECGWLEALGLDVTVSPEIPDDLQTGAFDLLIMGRDTVRPGSDQNHQVRSFVERGGQVLLLEQRHSLFPGVAVQTRSLRHGFPRAPHHPVCDQLDETDLCLWGEEPFAAMEGENPIAHHCYLKGEDCALKPLIDAGEGGFGLKLPEYTVLGEWAHGCGRLLACQLRLGEKGASIPEARELFRRMIAYLVQPVEASQAFSEGALSDDWEPLLKAAESGGNAWLHLARDADLAALGQRMGVDLQVETRTVYQAVRKGAWPQVDGISHADLSGIDSMSYCFGAKSLPVAEKVLCPAEGLEAILVTSTDSAMEAMFVHGQRVEALRAHAASRFLFDEKPPEQVLLGRVRLGEGWVYLDSFLPEQEAHPNLRRFLSVFRRNLGHLEGSDPLKGEAVPAAVERGLGYPQRICRGALDASDGFKQMCEATRPSAERMAPSAMFTAGDWQVVDAETGEWHEAGPSTVLFTCFLSPRPRKVVMEDSGIPNPDSLTFLDVSAPGGTVALCLNGRSYESQSVQGGSCVFSDLELLEGFNQAVLVWREAPSGGSLHFRFRTIGQQPETDLFFLRPNDAASDWEQAEF